MIHGIGADILAISRIQTIFESKPEDAFFRLTFTEEERKIISSRPSPLYSYATRFAGKEAVFKSLRVDSDAVRLNEIEILEDETGAPTVRLSGNALVLAEKFSISNVHISLSFDGNYACAYAIAEK